MITTEPVVAANIPCTGCQQAAFVKMNFSGIVIRLCPSCAGAVVNILNGRLVLAEPEQEVKS